MLNNRELSPRFYLMKIVSIKPILRASVLLAVVSSAACTWVAKTPEAKKVRVVPIDRVADCTTLGQVVASTTGNITVVKRSKKKVKSELETIAQNEAATSGADTIAPISEVVDGMQTFAIYRCL